jgi:nitronate monooxygenase
MSRLPGALAHLPFPVIGSPLFIISNPKLVVAQCIAGVVGSMPALNARPAEQLEEWLIEITETLAAYNAAHPDRPAAPFAINQIVHKSNDRLEHDMALCVKYKVPIIITSLGAREDINAAAHSYGGVVLHDVINNKHAHKAIEKGADGLIAVAAGLGGHAGVKSPFALIQEIRQWFDGPWRSVAPSLQWRCGVGRTGHGCRLCLHRLGLHCHRRSACCRGLQAGHCGQQFRRHRLQQPVYRRAWQLPGPQHPWLLGLDPDNLPVSDPSKMNFGGDKSKAWKDIWGCGQGIGAITEVATTANMVARLKREYLVARARLAL